MDDLDNELKRRYDDMMMRCGFTPGDWDIPAEEEETSEYIDTGDIGAYDPKPELVGKGVKFERLRRVTGYISGRGIDGMNNAKQAEVRDRMTSTKRVESYYGISQGRTSSGNHYT